MPSRAPEMVAGRPTPAGRNVRRAGMIAGMLVLQSLGACAPILTYGLDELISAIERPNEDELRALKAKAKAGDQDAQFELSRDYSLRIYTRFDRAYHDRIERAAARLRRCAAEGGSHSARIGLWLYQYLAEADGPAFVYKHSRIAAQQEECACERGFPFVWGSCIRLCSNMKRAAELLEPADRSRIDSEIAEYQPSPRACEVEIPPE